MGSWKREDGACSRPHMSWGPVGSILCTLTPNPGLLVVPWTTHVAEAGVPAIHWHSVYSAMLMTFWILVK